MNKNLPRLFKNPFSKNPLRNPFRALRLHRKHALLLTCLATTALLQPSEAAVQKVLSAVYEKQA